MSWLFDRLTELAVADHLAIIVDTETADDLEPVLNRAAALTDTKVLRGNPQRRSSGCHDRPAFPVGESRLVASGGGSARPFFADLGAHDLGVSIAVHAPNAALRVERTADLRTLLESLVTLRSYAQRTAR